MDLSTFPTGGIVEVRTASREPRPADRTIAARVDRDGIYRVDQHLAEARPDSRHGDDPDGFVGAHVRRLESLRRAGLVERVEDGLWRVPADYLDRAAAHEAGRFGGASVELRSHLPIAKQTRAIGATWLDRALIEGASPAANGFGAEVRGALEERGAFLVEEGLANRRGQRLILTRDLLATLRGREVANVGQTLGAETGLEHRAVADGEKVAGVYRRSIMLASGRFAMLDDGVGFSLVPWKSVPAPWSIADRRGSKRVGILGVVASAGTWSLKLVQMTAHPARLEPRRRAHCLGAETKRASCGRIRTRDSSAGSLPKVDATA